MSNKKSQQEQPYRAMIGFNILFDLDLNANHLRLYGQIEQMESNFQCQPFFSNAWMAEQLNIDRRSVIRIATKLKDKGYIERVENGNGKHIWRTVRNVVMITDDPNSTSSTSDTQSHPPVTPSVTPPVTPSVTDIRTQNINTQKINILTPEKKEKAVKVNPVEYQETYYPVESNTVIKEVSPTLRVTELAVVQDNPHNIPDTLLVEWAITRRMKRSPINPTTWKQMNSQLSQCKAGGIEPIEAFTKMVAFGWPALDAAKMLKFKNNKGSELDLVATSWINEMERDLEEYK